MNNIRIVAILKPEIVKYFELQNNIVYIGQQNIEHIRKKYFSDYELFFEKLSEIIINPDYIGKHQQDGSLELIKRFVVQEKYYVKVAVRISKNNILFVRTLYTLNNSKFLYKLNKKYYKKIVDIQ